MKIFIILFCFLIVGLSGIPTIKFITQSSAAMDCCGDDRCEAPLDNQKSSKSENCNGNACNPFATCCAGLLDIISINNYTIVKPQVIVEHQFIYLTLFKSKFSFDFWQPPKLV